MGWVSSLQPYFIRARQKAVSLADPLLGIIPGYFTAISDLERVD